MHLLRFCPSFVYLLPVFRSQPECDSLREAPTLDPRLTESPLPLSSLPHEACLPSGLWSALLSVRSLAPEADLGNFVFVLNSNIWCQTHDRFSRCLLSCWPESSYFHSVLLLMAFSFFIVPTVSRPVINQVPQTRYLSERTSVSRKFNSGCLFIIQNCFLFCFGFSF